MDRFKLFINFLIISICFQCYTAKISDKRLCMDAKCSSPVSHAKTLTRYFGPEKYYLSFQANADVIIYSKSAGSNEALWGAEIDGKRGYIPKSFVRESQVLGKPSILVDTEISNDSNVPQVLIEKESVRPSRVKQSHEVIDGTTIYVQPEEIAQEKFEVESDKPPHETSTENIVEDNTRTNEVDGINSENAAKVSEDDQNAKNSEISNASNEKEKLTDYKKDEEPEKENIVTANSSEKKSESSQSDLDDMGYLSGMFDVLGMVMNTGDKGEEAYKENKEESEPKEASLNEEINKPESKPEESVLNKPETIENSSEDSKVENLHSKDINSNSNSLSEEKPGHNLEATVEVSKNIERKDFVEEVKTETITENSEEVNLKENESKLDESLNLSNNSFMKTEETDENQLDSQKQLLTYAEQIATEESISKSLDKLNENQEWEEPAIVSEEIRENEVPVTETQHLTSDLQVESSDIQSEYDEKRDEASEKNLPDQQYNSTKLDNLNNDSNISVTSENESQSITSQIVQNPVEDLAGSELKHNLTEPEKEIYEAVENQNVTEDIDSNEISLNDTEVEVKNVNIEKEPQILNNLFSNQFSRYQEPKIKFEEPALSEDVPSHISPEQKVEKSTSSDIISDDTPLANSYENFHHRDEQMNQNTEELTALHDNNTNNIPLVTENNEKENQQETTPENVHQINESEEQTNSLTPDLFNSNQDNEKSHVENDFQGEHNLENQLDQNESEGRDRTSESNIDIGNEAPGIFSYFGKGHENEKKDVPSTVDYAKREEGLHEENDYNKDNTLDKGNTLDKDDLCIKTSRPFEAFPMELPNLGSDFFLYLVTTAISVILFLLGYLAVDKSRREGPLIGKINQLEKALLVSIREKEILVEEVENGVQKNDYVASQEFFNLQQAYEGVIKEKQGLEDQIQTLEKELENSTELGLELNRMLSDILSSENAGATLMTNIEGLQAQLAEQQDIVSNMKEILSLKETENHELNLDLDITNKKVVELQNELDKLLLNIIKIEEQKELQEKNSRSEITDLREKIGLLSKKLDSNQEEYTKKLNELGNQLSTSEHNLQLKIKEYDGLKHNVKQMKDMKNTNTLESLLEVTSIKAELEQLKAECQSHSEYLRREKELNSILGKRAKDAEDEIDVIKGRFDEADKARLELETKLQVLTNYFKEKEAQLQKELSKYESMWSTKQGEATSTSERIKYLQSEVQNYKTQNESLKQEIVSQEVELKSQISVLEKKVHENWVSARQAERRLEDLKHEAAQLRNRLTLRERALQEDKAHNRMQSPLEQNPDLPISPLHLDSPASPPLMYNSRDHITKSPPILGMPPPFLPPPHGAPFLPPPHLPFMPPPPHDMFPGDHRPPPLGRMSSPPLNSRYSPDRSYSPYERRSPSPPYDESEYGTSPVHHRRYSPFSGRKDHRRMPPPMGRLNGNSAMSSGSNDSLDELNHSHSKV